MNCRDAEKEMILSLSNDLDPHKQRILESHMRDCPSCSKKYKEIEKDLEWMAALPGRRPEFDWNKSWSVIRNRLARNTWARGYRILQTRKILKASAALGILFLGIVIGRYVLLPPGTDMSLQTRQSEIANRLIQQHLSESGLALLEFYNRRSLAADIQIFDLEKQHARYLLFQNRTLQAFLEEYADPSVIALLRDIEILLFEAANMEAASTETHAFIKTLIDNKDIFFRIRHIGKYQASIAGKEAKL
jgi:hypothetical protein